MFNRKRIEFVCSSGIPYERVQYLESLGVKVWPTGDIHEDKDNGTRTAVVLVRSQQRLYAAGLLQGLGDTTVLDPHPVAPIQPRTRWGVVGKRAQGPNATALRVVAGLLGIKAKTPPIGAKPTRPKKTTPTTKRRKPVKRKSTKPSAVKRIWDSLKDE